MWSPLEKTVILPIAAFGLTYTAWLGLVAPLLAVSFAFIGWYLWTRVNADEVVIITDQFKISAVVRNIVPLFVAVGAYIHGASHVVCFGLLTLYYMLITQQWNIKHLLNYVKFDVLAIVAVVIVLGNYFKTQGPVFEAMIKGSALDPQTFVGMAIISAIGFAASFLMGSSGKFVAFAVLMAQLFGVEYFLWFFAIDFAGYLVSPTHKCVMIGNRYFGTPLKTYYLALGTWGLLLITAAGLLTFLPV